MLFSQYKPILEMNFTKLGSACFEMIIVENETRVEIGTNLFKSKLQFHIMWIRLSLHNNLSLQNVMRCHARS